MATGTAGSMEAGVVDGVVMNASVAPLQGAAPQVTFDALSSAAPAPTYTRSSAAPAAGTAGESTREKSESASAGRRLSRLKPGSALRESTSSDDRADFFVEEQVLVDMLNRSASNAADADAGSPDAGKDGATLLSSDELDRLVRVLDRRLVLVAIAQLLGDEDRVRSLAAELGLPMTDGSLLVAIKLDEAAIERARALGLSIEATDAARGLAVARVPVTSLAKLAAIDGVKRVEPLLR